jgi:hypothetical protein
MTARIESFKEERGQDILEYAVLAGGIALVLGFVLFAAGGNFLFEGFTTFAEEVEACITFSTDCGN